MKVKKERHRKDSRSSEEDLPLYSYKEMKRENGNTCTLHQQSVEKCDMCDEVFNNKCALMVHNAQHIIIPLLRQQFYQCAECLHHFTSVESLQWHTVNKHPSLTEKTQVPELLNSFVMKEPVIVVKPTVELSSNTNSKDAILKSMLKREPITLLTKEYFGLNGEDGNAINCNGHGNNYNITKNTATVKPKQVETEVNTNLFEYDGDVNCNNSNLSRRESLLQSFVLREPVTLLTKEEFNVENDEDIPIYEISDDSSSGVSDAGLTVNVEIPPASNNYINDDEFIDKSNLFEFNLELNSNNTRRLKDKLMFEDEQEEANCLMNYLTISECKVNVEKLDGNTGDVRKLMEKPVRVPNSVHYDELMEPGDYMCKTCNKWFPNRYNCIIHETLHLNFKPRRMPFLCRHCDWYICMARHEFKQHMDTKHPERSHKPSAMIALSKCRQCGLSYVRHDRHLANYHRADVPQRERPPWPSLGAQMRARAGWSARTLRVCDLCYAFFRNTQNLTYKVYGEHTALGARLQCERCDKLFFCLNVVERKCKMRKQRLDYRRKQTYSNSERLKNVQKRLKKLKKLNKF